MRKRLISLALAVVLLLSTAVLPVPARAASSMTISAEALAILKKIEGFALHPYPDNTQYSVGYGTKCPDELLDHYMTYGITEAEAEALLQSALTGFEASVNRFIDEHGLSLPQNKFDALVLFSYNCGAGWTGETTGFFYNAVKNGVTGTAFLYAICLWSTSAGKYILIKRRMSEANMYLNGVYEAYNDSNDGTYPDTFRYVFMDGNGGKAQYGIHAYDATENSEIITAIKEAPRGADGSGNVFTYEFAGWYTESTGGTKVERLDGSLPDGATLYAQWKNPAGEIVPLPGVDELTWPQSGVVTGIDVKVRSGPGTFNPVQYLVTVGNRVTIHERASASGLYWGRLDDGNWICLDYVSFIPTPDAGDEPVIVNSGDINGDNAVNKDDAIHLLRHVVFPEAYGIASLVTGDVNADGAVNKDDAIYLLRHVVFPSDYPLR